MKTPSIFAFLSMAFAVAPLPAAVSKTATFTVSFYVPLQCEVVVLGSTITGKRMVVDVSRTCNSRHALTVSGGAVDGLGRISIGSGDGHMSAGLNATFFHHEQYVPSIEQIVFDCPDALPGSIERFASTISLGVEAT